MQIAKLNIEAGLSIEEEFGGEDFDGMTEQAVFTPDAYEQGDEDVLNAETRRYDGRNFQMPQSEQIPLLEDVRGADEDKAKEAFDVLAVHYHKELVRLATNWTGDFGDAEDLAQNVWIKAWRNRRKISANGRFWMYIKKGLLNEIRNRHRNLEKRRTDIMDMTDPDRVHSASPDMVDARDPAKIAEKNELLEAARDSLSRLKPNESKALTMQSSGVKGKDIAKELGLKPNRVKSLLANAKKKLEADLLTRYPELFTKPE